mmetsp:Transcript_54665/g.118187  ORF Transcript_54665/g.118187 Transcript_54665/m.118187 type:complete len:200 (-) Transcript_54665:796-1395(-)
MCPRLGWRPAACSFWLVQQSLEISVRREQSLAGSGERRSLSRRNRRDLSGRTPSTRGVRPSTPPLHLGRLLHCWSSDLLFCSEGGGPGARAAPGRSRSRHSSHRGSGLHRRCSPASATAHLCHGTSRLHSCRRRGLDRLRSLAVGAAKGSTAVVGPRRLLPLETPLGLPRAAGAPPACAFPMGGAKGLAPDAREEREGA